MIAHPEKPKQMYFPECPPYSNYFLSNLLQLIDWLLQFLSLSNIHGQQKCKNY